MAQTEQCSCLNDVSKTCYLQKSWNNGMLKVNGSLLWPVAVKIQKHNQFFSTNCNCH